MATIELDAAVAKPAQLLQQHFGFAAFKPGQQEVIEHLLAGRSAAAVFPTGGGKSLCYQLPALALDGVTLVVSPLIALMKDQIDALAERGIAAARLDSTLSLDEYRDVMDRVRSGALRLLYVAPERFNNERFRQAIERVRVSLFAVDEAHCISEWGHNFRPDYLKLADFAKQCGAERMFALTATATDAVLDDICEQFDVAPDCAVRTGLYRPNLTLRTTPVAEKQRDQLLIDRLRERPVGSTIVYVTLQRTAEEVAQQLAAAGFAAKHYHAGMKPEERAATQDWFLESDRGIVVATIAFGMGIDKPNIRYVYHYNPPKSLENYSQEIGRAGRDDDPSTCELLLATEDLNVLENFIYGDTPTHEAIRSLVGEVFSLGDAFDVSTYELSNTHDIRLLVVRTLLTYLELEGLLEGGTPFYSSYQFKPLVPSTEILSKFEGDRRDFVAGIFRRSQKGKTWFKVDVETVATELGADRQRVVRALDYLGEQQQLEVKAAGVRLRYRRLASPENLDALAESLFERMTAREQAELNRLTQVVELVTLDACQASALGEYFGQPLDAPCGHCSWCLDNHQAKVVSGRTHATIDEKVWQQAMALRKEHPEVLDDPRSLARLLAGVTSPRLIRAKLSRDKLFGTLADVPFEELLRRAAEHGS